MILRLTHSKIRTSDCLDRWIQEALAEFRPLLRIDEARIRLEYRPETKPPFVASAHLVVPGPDVRAEAADHTLRTALRNLMQQLHSKVCDRVANRKRTASQPQLPRLCTEQRSV